MQEGRKEGFDYLYQHYSAALYGIIFRILRDEALASETLHDAFMKIWDKIKLYDSSKGTLYTWMARICRNLAIDVTRSKNFNKSRKTDTVEDSVYVIDRQVDIQINTDIIGIKQLLYKLNDEQRFVIHKLYFDGFTQAEIADEFDIPLGTVKTRTRLALKKLKELVS